MITSLNELKAYLDNLTGVSGSLGVSAANPS